MGLSRVLVLAGMVLLASCGGGGGGGSGAAGDNTSSSDSDSMLRSAALQPIDNNDAYRFLTQATFGPTPDQAAHLRAVGYAQWINEQFSAAPSSTHQATVLTSSTFLQRPHPMLDDVIRSWWTHAIKDDQSQLRHRVAFALSEIFVVSTVTLDQGSMVASYMDMLTSHADGSYRDLLQAVAMHPAMGVYLSHLGNLKEDNQGRVPDENFAREVMQLFSIGLYELDDSGRPILVNGKPVETYSAADVKGLAKVFTGFSWNRPSSKMGLGWWVCYYRGPDCQDASQMTLPMSAYTEAHSTSVKQFLGVTIPAQNPADPATSLKIALDTLANHHNTAPFISRQLIQRLVTSNPSPAYVADVTRVFRQSNGNLRQVVTAILTHDEARHPATAALSTYGKLREPLLRLTHLFRTIPHNSDCYNAGGAAPFYFAVDSSDPGTGLGQAPMRSPSVFNFFRPGYTPPQSSLSGAGLVAPEMQITSETSVLGYANFVSTILDRGWGEWSYTFNRMDITFDLSGWMSVAGTSTSLVDAVSTKMLGKTLPAAARSVALTAVDALPSATTVQKRQRIEAAILMVALSPDFLIQQ
ncbi:MAG: DUF1800 domain-containing protein [Aquabacterium sp.]